jgi:hypothetical protein
MRNPQQVQKAAEMAGTANETANKTVDHAGGVSRLAGAAAVGAGVAALATGSLFVAPILGAGALVYATTRDDGIGEAARASGDAAVVGYGKARELNEQYHLDERARVAAQQGAQAANSAYIRAREFNEQYHLDEKAREAAHLGVQTANGAYVRAKALNEEYQIDERARAAAQQAAQMANAAYVRAGELNTQYHLVDRASDAARASAAAAGYFASAAMGALGIAAGAPNCHVSVRLIGADGLTPTASGGCDSYCRVTCSFGSSRRKLKSSVARSTCAPRWGDELHFEVPQGASGVKLYIDVYSVGAGADGQDDLLGKLTLPLDTSRALAPAQQTGELVDGSLTFAVGIEPPPPTPAPTATAGASLAPPAAPPPASVSHPGGGWFGRH